LDKEAHCLQIFDYTAACLNSWHSVYVMQCCYVISAVCTIVGIRKKKLL